MGRRRSWARASWFRLPSPMTDAARVSIHASAVLVGKSCGADRGPSGPAIAPRLSISSSPGRSGQNTPGRPGRRRSRLSRCGGTDKWWVRTGAPTGRPDRNSGARHSPLRIPSRRAVVGLVVDLGAADAERLPQPEPVLDPPSTGVWIPRIPRRILVIRPFPFGCAAVPFDYSRSFGPSPPTFG